jgi:phosphoglucosamine mutase
MQTRSSKDLGKVRRLNDAPGRYIEFCKSSFPADLDLKGLKIALDCAHGACYHVTPPVFHELGAEIHVIGNTPDGMNINDQCGATHTQAIAQFTRSIQADIGIAVDGDGDRLMMCDQSGRIFDGDDLLFAIARDRQRQGLLGGGVMGTLMTNYAVERAFAAEGIPFERAKVGDRYVLEALLKNNWLLGGENSGHIICLDRHTTGDATVAALQVLAALQSHRVSLSDWLGDLQRLPQVLINVRVNQPRSLEGHPEVLAATAHVQETLQGRGRVLLRASGTEPLMRVMVEGEDLQEVHALAEQLAEVVRQAT